MTKRGSTVCIIGAGESGIAALKECVLQGLKPTCYELDSDIGGLWHAKPTGEASETPSIWPNLVTNNSKYNVAFSDFPPDPKDPVFISPKQLCDYFKRVIDHFGLKQFIHLNVRVVKVRETHDHAETGRWEVYTEDSRLSEGQVQSQPGGCIDLTKCLREVFDNVIVCSGWYKVPFYPVIPGLSMFKGDVSHSFNYANPRPFDGKSVLVVGNKFSAAEIVTDVANLAKKTYLALGKGTWIVPRMCQGQRPLDLSIPRSLIYDRYPEAAFNNFVLRESTTCMDHTSSGVGTEAPPSRSAICISDDLPVKIASGHIEPYGHLKKVAETSAIFEEGETIHDLEAIIFCTGYRAKLDFVDLKIHDSDGKMELYLMAFPLNRRHNTLAVIGHYGTDGPMIVIGENQARVVARVMSGRHELPPQEVMSRDASLWNAASQAARPGLHSYLVPGFALMDAIAYAGGFYPSFWKLLFRDPVLAWRTWHGPYLAAQYRLLGPDSQWAEARLTCYTAYSEMMSCVRHAKANVVQRPDLWPEKRDGLIVITLLTSALVGLNVLRYCSSK